MVARTHLSVIYMYRTCLVYNMRSLEDVFFSYYSFFRNSNLTYSVLYNRLSSEDMYRFLQFLPWHDM